MPRLISENILVKTLVNPIYLEVAVPVPLRHTFHYLAPINCPVNLCKTGLRVEVSFGRQKLIGVILGQTESIDLPAEKIKPAESLLDTEPVLPNEVFKLCLWAADYYHHPIGEVLHTALPVLLRQGESTTGSYQRLIPLWTDPEPLSKAPRQRALVVALLEQNQSNGQGLSKAELKDQEFTTAIIKGVIEKGAAEWQTFQDAPKPASAPPAASNHLPPSTEQKRALDSLKTSGTHLLFGVTGSGKTEVYLQAIAEVIAKGQQALVLVPEIGLTPQTIRRFEERFSVGVVAMHSGLNNRERLSAWRDAASGRASVIIGTRSAIFTPMKSPGLIVIDEEHDASFKQQEGFRYSARDLAVKRGHQEKIPVILGSATPALESYANAINGKYQMLRLDERANKAKVAQYKIMGIEHQTLSEGFSPQLIELMRVHLEGNNQVLVFLNRRGFAPVLHCRQCLWLSSCQRCDAKMTYHLSSRTLVCHHCSSSFRAPTQCPDCKSRELVPLGLGTQRLEAGLEQLFPDENILRIDRDSTRLKGALTDKIAEANKGQRGILLGTQLLAKGHHFPNVTLVAVIDLDSGFYSSDYHAIERTGQLLLQVGGRAGREQKQGTVAIQTLFPEQPMLRCLIEDGYETFCEALLKEREQNQLPPYTFQAVIRAEAVKAGNAINFLEGLSNSCTHHELVELLGPIPSAMEKRAGKYRAQLLISSTNRRYLHQTIASAVKIAEKLPSARSVRWSIDVDPFDLF
ncbi:MAG: primosomal protein N' (replication factor Y) [Candidatus Azotimanducaceae bacterium]|jgi:primosomal protein N' (replication factor Y)